MDWLAEGDGWRGTPRVPFLVAWSTLHLVASLGAAKFVRVEIRRLQLFGMRARLLQAMPLLLAMPFPLSAVGLLAWGPLLSENREQKTLVHAIHDRRMELRGPERASTLGGLRLDGSLSSIRGEERADIAARRRSPELGRAEQHRRAFYRLKSLLLFLDAGALGWGLSRCVLHTPIVTRSSPSALLASFLVAIGLGLLVDGIALASRLTGWGQLAELWTRYPFGRFLALTQAVFLSGFFAGCLLAAGDAGMLGVLLVAIGYVGISAFFLLAVTAFVLEMPGRSTPVAVVWLLLLFEVPILGSLLQVDASTARPVLALLRWSFALTPLWSLGLALAFGGSLLRPVGWRRIACGDLPPGTRTGPALLALAVTLPLGGLAIPFAIYVERRLWPGYERWWSGESREGTGGPPIGNR
jgi:hypothetical protein